MTRFRAAWVTHEAVGCVVAHCVDVDGTLLAHGRMNDAEHAVESRPDEPRRWRRSI
jgi:hypothetical protein